MASLKVLLTLAFLVNCVKAEKDLVELLNCCKDDPLKEDRAVVELGYLTAVRGLHNR